MSKTNPKYDKYVADFVNESMTPMTVVIQGSWGSGKNGILKMLSNSLEKSCNENLIWFHTWQFSQFDLGEQLPMVVGNRLINLLSGTNNGAAKDRAIKVAKGLINITSGFISQGSTDGQNFMDALFKDNSTDSLEKLVRNFSETVKKRMEGGNGKVVVFIDDLEGKSFFDKMFQVSFRIPTSGYNIENYVKEKLEHIEIYKGDEEELEFYVELIKNSVGSDPKVIDRLFNSFLLLTKLADEELYENKDKRLMLFALICMQTKFREVYDFIVRMKAEVTPDFLLGLCSEQSPALEHSSLGDEGKMDFCDFAKVFLKLFHIFF